jgi:hypothetical protein
MVHQVLVLLNNTHKCICHGRNDFGVLHLFQFLETIVQISFQKCNKTSQIFETLTTMPRPQKNLEEKVSNSLETHKQQDAP